MYAISVLQIYLESSLAQCNPHPFSISICRHFRKHSLSLQNFSWPSTWTIAFFVVFTCVFVGFLFASLYSRDSILQLLAMKVSNLWEGRRTRIWTFTGPSGSFLGEGHEKFLKGQSSASAPFIELFLYFIILLHPLITGFRFDMSHTWFFLSSVFHLNTSKCDYLSYLLFPLFSLPILSTDFYSLSCYQNAPIFFL